MHPPPNRYWLVVGAGYAVSDSVGNVAVIVKLFRVLLLLPTVLAIGWVFTRTDRAAAEAHVPVPVFAIVFVGLCLGNSFFSRPSLAVSFYPPVKAALVEASTWGLLIAIAALALGTSLGSLLRIGWRHLVVIAATTLTILLAIVAALIAQS